VDREVFFSEVADVSILRETQRELGIKDKSSARESVVKLLGEGGPNHFVFEP
jgi:hypothetical protein